jgi:hypothetical protein
MSRSGLEIFAGAMKQHEARKAEERAAFDRNRREFQRTEAQRIGEGSHQVPKVDRLTLIEALERFVFLSDGSQVVDLYSPHFARNFADFRGTYAASTDEQQRPDGRRRNIPVADLWREDPRRKTAECRTFKAGGPIFLLDPEGRTAVNSWRPFDRTVSVSDADARECVALLLAHLEYLFPNPEDLELFLDWLAHIEQRPGELPHIGFLHVATKFGLGRNWLASALARVWAGHVATNFDLVATLRSGFNGRLSRKILAVVDEIREGGRDSQWEHSEKMKSLINEETRAINPKYGRQSVEFNACRWLMFSNHVSAIPLEDNDRRFEVVINNADPMPPDYYVRLYRVLDDPKFPAAIARFLALRDIRRFNPGAHARQTEGKRTVTRASRTPMADNCELLVEHWPNDLITTSELFEILSGERARPGQSLNASHRRTLERYGIESLGKTVRITTAGSDRVVRVVAIRNRSKWIEAETSEVRDELSRGRNAKRPRNYDDTALVELMEFATGEKCDTTGAADDDS